MELQNPLGSVSALSLAANPLSLPVIATIAGVGVTVAAATITYKAYKNYEAKKDRKEIERINALHEKHLAKIFIPGYNEVQGFPAIFKLTENKDSSTADSLHYTDDDVINIGKSLPHGGDIALTPYRQAILNAILKLQEYYLMRKDHRDITAGVLSYLLNMLQTKCLSFEGYDYDIAYIKALSKFINEYATQFGEKSQHFTRLNIIYSYLLTAQQKLEMHKEKLSLDEILGELRDSCIHENDLLIRKLAQMIIPNKNWELLKTVTHEELAQGILRREYVHSEIKGFVLEKDHKETVPLTPLKSWLTGLSQYFQNVLDPDTGISSNDIKSPVEMFTYPDLNKLKELQAIIFPCWDEVNEINKIDTDLDEMRNVFEKSKNFITTKLDPKTKNKLPRFISISGNQEMIDRTKIIAEFATLIHQSISLQYLCTHLLKCTRQLGEIYVRNPQHFCRIFSILNQLCKRITDKIDFIRKEFTDIQRDSLNNMQLAEKELFPEEVKDILDSLHTRITNIGMQVNTYREKAEKNLDPAEPTAKSVKQEMFEVATLLCDMYQICGGDSIHNESTTEKSLVADKSSTHKQIESLDKIMTSINSRIIAIQQIELPEDSNGLHKKFHTAENNAYTDILENLAAIQNKAEQLINEADTTDNRNDKALKTIQLAITISKQTLAYLQHSQYERVKSAAVFNQAIRAQLIDDKNHFLDEHSNHFNLFNTQSRKVFMNFSESCDNLAKTLATSFNNGQIKTQSSI